MDFPLPETQKNPKVFLQRAGYHEFVDPNTGDRSFVRRLSQDFYPRFHIYIDEDQRGTIISLHIDQKHHVYDGVRAHAGEYSGPVVEQEAARLKDAAENPDALVKLAKVDTGAKPKFKPGGIITDRTAKDLRKKLGI